MLHSSGARLIDFLTQARRINTYLCLRKAIICLLSLCISNFIYADNSIQIVSEENPTLNYTDKDGSLKGYAAEIVRAVMEDSGLDYQMAVKPWPRAFLEVQNTKDTLIYSLGRTAEREEQFIWIGKIITFKNFVYTLRKADGANKISMDELKKNNVAVLKNTMNYHYLRKNDFKNLVYVTSYEHAFKLLERGRINYFTSSVIGIMQHIKNNNLDAKIVEPVMPLHKVNSDLYLAANIQTKPDTIKRIKASFQRIIDNGTYKKIMQPLVSQ
jgi:polar amino acid transport system substrate-binding protein